MQNRYGPNRVGPFGLFQPVAMASRCLIKEDVVPRARIRCAFFAPILVAATAILTLGVIPYGRNMTPFRIDGGILFFFAVGSPPSLRLHGRLGQQQQVFNARAQCARSRKWSATNCRFSSPRSGGDDRGLTLAGCDCRGQVGLFFGILPHWFVTTPWGAAAFILFFVSGLVESNRTPFDVPEGESKLSLAT
jgi:NADH-quinone oxidoreductase subunit H